MCILNMFYTFYLFKLRFFLAPAIEVAPLQTNVMHVFKGENSTGGQVRLGAQVLLWQANSGVQLLFGLRH